MIKTTKDELFTNLKHRILTMELEPGESINEAMVGQEYGFSRTPVRDVLRQLAGEGYLTIKENYGTFVASMDHKTLRNFFRTAPAIYSSIAVLAVENWKPKQLVALKDAQIGFRQAIESSDANQMAVLNNKFHLIMGEMADNPYLQPSLQRLLIDHARIGQTFYSPTNETMKERLATACHHHDEFITVIEERDGTKAKQLSYDHWELSRVNMEIYARPDPLEMEMDMAQSKAS